MPLHWVDEWGKDAYCKWQVTAQSGAPSSLQQPSPHWQQVGCQRLSQTAFCWPPRPRKWVSGSLNVRSLPSHLWRFSTAWYGTVRYGTVHFWGVFHWVLYLVPDTFLVPLRSRFHANRTVTKTWRVNSADHWLAWDNRHYCVTELATRDPPLQSYPLDLNQHSQRRIGRNFCLNKCTFLHQPQNSSVVVCWGSTDVLLVDSRGADPARAWWRDAEGKSLMYITLLLNLLYLQSMFSVYIFTSVSVFCFN